MEPEKVELVGGPLDGMRLRDFDIPWANIGEGDTLYLHRSEGTLLYEFDGRHLIYKGKEQEDK
jgi:hypothetical protein